ncbi:MAG TPA: cyclase family protein [Gemmatimonadaceae bacterium]|nr:cyclase family protein [Gemmatimonadaceae bacterium]
MDPTSSDAAAPPAPDGAKRVRFDFEVEFTNGGGLVGRDFRLDIQGDDITDEELAEYVVTDLRLLMVGHVRIRNRTVYVEPHRRATPLGATQPAGTGRIFVDLSHTIEHGMVTYRGLPAPLVCDFLSREASRAVYAPGTEFQIGRIDMVANTGTYLDSPFHRFADGPDLSELELASLAELEGVIVRVTGQATRAITRATLLGALAGIDVRGKAVLVHTGWDEHWRTDRYFEGHPYLTSDAARQLAAAGAALVGIDSLNIDDTADDRRPVHTTLLGARIAIVEHLRGLARLPVTGFRFSAVPVKVKGMGTFPVRAYATLPG